MSAGYLDLLIPLCCFCGQRPVPSAHLIHFCSGPSYASAEFAAGTSLCSNCAKVLRACLVGEQSFFCDNCGTELWLLRTITIGNNPLTWERIVANPNTAMISAFWAFKDPSALNRWYTACYDCVNWILWLLVCKYKSKSYPPHAFETDHCVYNYCGYCDESIPATWEWLVCDLYTAETPNVREVARYIADLLWTTVWLAFAGNFDPREVLRRRNPLSGSGFTMPPVRTSSLRRLQAWLKQNDDAEDVDVRGWVALSTEIAHEEVHLRQIYGERTPQWEHEFLDAWLQHFPAYPTIAAYFQYLNNMSRSRDREDQYALVQDAFVEPMCQFLQQRDISEVLLMCLLSLLKAKEITSESFRASFRNESQGKGSAKGKGKGKPGK